MKLPSRTTLIPALLILLVGLTIAASAYAMERVSVLLVAMAAGLGCVVLGVVDGAWRSLSSRPVAPTVRRLGLSLLIIASVAVFHWPLKVTYHLSRSSLDRIADQLKAGASMTFPQSAGVFTVHHGSIGKDGIACLWLSPSPDYSTGFVRTAPDHLPFNLWSVISLGREWQYVCLD